MTESSGIGKVAGGFGLTAVAADFDDDGWPDIYVACDSTPSLLFHNNHDGTFTEQAMERGAALSEDGMEQAGMGLAIGDFQLDGRLGIVKTHFQDDTVALYLNNGKGTSGMRRPGRGLGVETRYVSWGAGVADFDNDGAPVSFGSPATSIPKRRRSWRAPLTRHLECCFATWVRAGSSSSSEWPDRRSKRCIRAGAAPSEISTMMAISTLSL